MILLILALIWAAALLPPLVRSRLEGNPVDSVGRFRRHLRVLENTSPLANDLAHSATSNERSSMPKAWAIEAQRLRLLRRRQQIAVILLASMATTLILGLVPEMRALLVLHGVVDVAFFTYVALLVKARNERLRTRMAARSEVVEAPSEVVAGQHNCLSTQAL